MYGKRIATMMVVTIAAAACSDGPSLVEPADTQTTSLSSTGDAWVEMVTGSAHTIGTFNDAPFPRNLQFSARRNSDGDVSGQFQLNTGFVRWNGPVLCFEIVSETQVRIGGLADRIQDPKGIFFGDATPPRGVIEIFAIVSDNGEGSSDDPDSATPIFIGGPGTAAEGCGGGADGTPETELASGNVQIHTR